HGCELNVLAIHQLIAGPEAVEEDVAGIVADAREAGAVDWEPSPDLGLDRPPVRKPLIVQQGGFDAVVGRAQSSGTISGREVSFELEGQRVIGRSGHGQLESSANIANSRLVRESRCPGAGNETLRLNPADRDFGEDREAADRSIFHLKIELLKVYVIRGAGLWSRCASSVATALRVEELGAIGSIIFEARVEANSNLRTDDGVVNVADHAALKGRPGGFLGRRRCLALSRLAGLRRLRIRLRLSHRRGCPARTGRHGGFRQASRRRSISQRRGARSRLLFHPAQAGLLRGQHYWQKNDRN